MKIQGFTLMELLIAVAIVGILASVAYPSYLDSVTKARRSDGQAKLLEVAQRLERFYTENNTYTTDLTDLSYAAAGAVDSDEGFYSVAVAAAAGGIAGGYILTATAQNAQASDAKCGNLSLSSTGVKGESGSGSAADCW